MHTTRPFRLLVLPSVVALVLPCGATSAQRIALGSAACAVSTGQNADNQHDESSVLTGRVLGHGVPVSDALVVLLELGVSCRTDSTGYFRFVGLRAGPQVLEVRRLGFVSLRDTAALRPDEETVHDVELTSTPVKLDLVRTRAAYVSPLLEGFEHRRTAGGMGHFITDSVLRRSENISMPSILRERVPGLRLIHYRGQEYIALGRGGNGSPLNPDDPKSPSACFPLIYMDGALIYDAPPMVPPPITQFAATNLSAIELYSGPATVPTQFKQISNECGALLFWRRQR